LSFLVALFASSHQTRAIPASDHRPRVDVFGDEEETKAVLEANLFIVFGYLHLI
jgi:hypothetical protein